MMNHNDNMDIDMDIDIDAARLLEEVEKVTPYGTRVMAPTAVIAPISQASQEAARNLLAKALARSRDGDSDGAEKLIRRAAGLAFDDHEQMWPATAAAGGLVHTLLSDQAELVADYNELLDFGNFDDDDEELEDLIRNPPAPVEFGLRGLRGHISELEAAVTRAAFVELVRDRDYLGISKAECQKILELLEGFPAPFEPLEVPETAPESEREDVIRACIRITLHLEEAFEE